MTVHVDSITSEVVPEQEPGGAAAEAGGSPDQDAERWRTLRERAARDAARTRAEAYDAT